MFELLFKYPPAVFSKGSFVLLARWPVSVLVVLVLGVAALLGVMLWRRRNSVSPAIRGWRTAAVWGLQTALVALLVLILWQPALSIASLKPQQNIIAVVVDDSRSMGIHEGGTARVEQAVRALNGGLMKGLEARFQIRKYSLGAGLQRIDKWEGVRADSPTTRIGEGLKMVMAEASNLPLGAVVLLTDGAENAGGIDLETVSEVRQRRIPIHTIGFGREKYDRDVEIADVSLPARAMPDSRLNALVSIKQSGYGGKPVRISLKDGSKVLASQTIQLKDEAQQTASVVFGAGLAQAHAFQVSIDPLAGEENTANNVVTRLVNVENRKARILYVEGEPRWEYKFIRRAVEDDRSLDIVSMLRTTQNKIYRQGVAEGGVELAHGFPAKPEELFEYDGLIIGSVEAGYLTAPQQEMVRDFVDRRGGGVLFLGGRSSLADGGYAKSPISDVLPVLLPDRKNTFQRVQAAVELTPAGRDNLMCRLVEDPDRNVERWKKLPKLADYQQIGVPKPGAVVLAEMSAGGQRLPLLVTQNYGRGRAAVFATSGSWRWQMQQELSDKTHEMFWTQLLRWLSNDSPGRILSSTPRQVLSDETKVALRAEVRGKDYQPVSEARVEAHITGPNGLEATVEMAPDPLSQGAYTADWTAEQPGSYLAEISAKRGDESLGHDMLTFRREDGVAENFHSEQNRDLLEKLSSQTGGRYWRPDEANKLGDEISYSEAGITVRETKDLWDMPIVFLLALGLKSAEWLLRRKWGVV